MRRWRAESWLRRGRLARGWFRPAYVRGLLDRHEQLHLYIDDSHGIGWSGRDLRRVGEGPGLPSVGPVVRRQAVADAEPVHSSVLRAGAVQVLSELGLTRERLFEALGEAVRRMAKALDQPADR